MFDFQLPYLVLFFDCDAGGGGNYNAVLVPRGPRGWEAFDGALEDDRFALFDDLVEGICVETGRRLARRAGQALHVGCGGSGPGDRARGGGARGGGGGERPAQARR